MTIENQVIELIATDRIEIPISSMSGKLKRQKPKIAKAIDLTEFRGSYAGERVYARMEEDDQMKARGTSEGIEEFSKKYQRHGKILQGLIEEKRAEHERHLYFGMNPNCRLTVDDYMGVMKNLGFTEKTSRDLYPQLMDVSRNLSKKRGEERSIMVG